MEPIPNDILTQFNAVLAQKAIPSASHDDYRKWLRYFLDYRLIRGSMVARIIRFHREGAKDARTSIGGTR